MRLLLSIIMGALTIAPGYQFQANELWTRDKLNQLGKAVPPYGVVLSPGYQFSDQEIVTIPKLNSLGVPSAAVGDSNVAAGPFIVTPGYVFSSNEQITRAKLNLLGQPGISGQLFAWAGIDFENQTIGTTTNPGTGTTNGKDTNFSTGRFISGAAVTARSSPRLRLTNV
jgi:hypothetical protein